MVESQNFHIEIEWEIKEQVYYLGCCWILNIPSWKLGRLPGTFRLEVLSLANFHEEIFKIQQHPKLYTHASNKSIVQYFRRFVWNPWIFIKFEKMVRRRLEISWKFGRVYKKSSLAISQLLSIEIERHSGVNEKDNKNHVLDRVIKVVKYSSSLSMCITEKCRQDRISKSNEIMM